MRSDEWRGVKWWRRGTYCCKGCRSRRAGAGREHWGAPSSFPLPVSVALPLSYVFSSSLQLLFALPRFFFLILETQPSSRSEKQEKPFGEKCQKALRGPTGWQARELKKERKTERCASVCVREKTTGWRRTPPTVAREREKHSFSLALSLACSLTPTHPSSLALLILRECLISLTRCLSPYLSPPQWLKQRGLRDVNQLTKSQFLSS